jgi:hypothetical protein
MDHLDVIWRKVEGKQDILPTVVVKVNEDKGSVSSAHAECERLPGEVPVSIIQEYQGLGVIGIIGFRDHVQVTVAIQIAQFQCPPGIPRCSSLTWPESLIKRFKP